MQKWLTLISHCLANFTNAVGYSLFFSNVPIFCAYYNVSEQAINNTFYIGLIIQIIFCLPAIRFIEWRLDYSVISGTSSIIVGAFLSTTAYWMQYFSLNNFFVGTTHPNLVICSLVLLSIGQAMIIPLSPYLAQRWFPLQLRSLAVGLSFYSNLTGLAGGAIFTSLYVTSIQHVPTQCLIIAIMTTSSFVVICVLIKNKPKYSLERYRAVTLKQFKQLWKYKFNTYSILMSSVFLGLSWSFLGFQSLMSTLFTPLQVGILISVWIITGATFGIIMSFLITRWITISGTFKCYDIFVKITLAIGILGYATIGLCYQFKVQNIVVYVVLMVAIGVGSIGYYGMVFLALTQSFYPLSSLLIGTLIFVGASLYSALATVLGQIPFINPFYLLAAVAFLPWVYLLLTLQTNFKRYRHYLDQQKAKFTLLKIVDNKSLFMSQKDGE